MGLATWQEVLYSVLEGAGFFSLPKFDCPAVFHATVFYSFFAYSFYPVVLDWYVYLSVSFTRFICFMGTEAKPN